MFEKIVERRAESGALVEGFFFSEVLKLMAGFDLRLTPDHYRGQDELEVIIAQKGDDGAIAAIAVMIRATIMSSGIEGCFTLGAIHYDSIDFVPFGYRLAAAPLSCL